jgi:lipopolysaccharide/colanic/teichoic acid biosynthesis glycosyltransferase
LDEADRVGLSLLSHRVLGTPEQVAEVLRNLDVHGVFVDRIVIATRLEALSPKAQQALRAVAQTRTIPVDFLDETLGLTERGGGPDDEAAAGPTQAFAISASDLGRPGRRRYLQVKRTFDIIAACVLLVVLTPVIALVGLLVAVDVGLPALFWQQRPGLCGRPFCVYKFRTMGAAYDAHGRRRTDDERVSALGAFLRRTRLDELPQLFNILAGHMSFVGPRPLLPVDQPAAYCARLLVRPGLTGWAQIKGGRTISAADKAALDVWYVNNLSLALDIKILLATVPMVMFGERVTEGTIVQAWRDLHAAGICDAPDTVLNPAYAFSGRQRERAALTG